MYLLIPPVESSTYRGMIPFLFRIPSVDPFEDPQNVRRRECHPTPVLLPGVGCHFLLQCMKVKSESEVAQSCPTLSDPMDCSPPGSSIHGIFQARGLEWGAIAFSDLYLRKSYLELRLSVITLPCLLCR